MSLSKSCDLNDSFGSCIPQTLHSRSYSDSDRLVALSFSNNDGSMNFAFGIEDPSFTCLVEGSGGCVKEFDGGRKGGGDGRRGSFGRNEMKKSVRHGPALCSEDGRKMGGGSRKLAKQEGGHSRTKEER